MRFYTVSNEYISFLQQHDNKVPNNSGTGYRLAKPYVGVVLEIDTHKFLAPLTSYKNNQDNIKSSSCTVFKLHERTNPDNKLGMIALRYMIPVHASEISELEVESQDDKYKRMLHMQYEFIKANREEIASRAAKLYDYVAIKGTPHYVNLSCNIPKLMTAYKNFKIEAAQDDIAEQAETPPIDGD